MGEVTRVKVTEQEQLPAGSTMADAQYWDLTCCLVAQALQPPKRLRHEQLAQCRLKGDEESGLMMAPKSVTSTSSCYLGRDETLAGQGPHIRNACFPCLAVVFGRDDMLEGSR
jgi:hypothetical protein